MTDGTNAPRRHWRWILPSAGAVVVIVVSIILATQSRGTAACTKTAAAPRWQPVAVALAQGGSASYYTAARGGECSFGPPSSDAYVALGPAEYAAGAACGEWLDVTGPTGTTRVEVVDECPSCPVGKIDLSKAAFARVGALSAGIIPVTYDVAGDPQPATAIRVEAKGGTAYSALSVVIDGHGDRLSTVELQTPTGFAPMKRGSDNFWTGPSGAVPAPFTLRITDVYGHQALAAGLSLGSSAFQQTTAMLYGAPPPSPSASPSPSQSPSSSASSTPSPSPSGTPLAAKPKC
jgi:expansin (peptidoglycan-binding protein)